MCVCVCVCVCVGGTFDPAPECDMEKNYFRCDLIMPEKLLLCMYLLKYASKFENMANNT